MDFSYRKSLQINTIIIIIVGFTYFYPSLRLPFLSDDYDSIYKCVNQDLLSGNWFRPFTDLTLKLNHLAHGYNPKPFHFFNVLIHIANSIIVMHILGMLANILYQPNIQSFKKLILPTSLLFLVSFNNSEPVSWVVGRGALLAFFFMGLATISHLKKFHYDSILFKILGPSAYFISLLSYESGWMFPFIIFLLNLLITSNLKLRENILSSLPYFIILLIYLILRILISGELLGTYGSEKVIGTHVIDVFFNVVKIIGRLLIYPDDAIWFKTGMAVLFISSIILIAFKTLRTNNLERYRAIIIITMLLFSIVPVAGLGVDTHDGEGGRYLYFCNFFLVLFILNFIASNSNYSLLKNIILWSLIVYNSIFLIYSHENWRIAAQISEEVIKEVSKYNGAEKIEINNLPGDYNGAFIFRNGLHKSLIIRDPSWTKSNLKINNTFQIASDNYFDKDYNFNLSFGLFESITPKFSYLIPITQKVNDEIEINFILAKNKNTKR